MLDFCCVTDHSIGADPRIFSNISAAPNDGSGSNVARTDEVGSCFNGGRGVNDDAFATGEEVRIVTSNLTGDAAHLCFQATGMLRVEQLPHRPVNGESREVPVFRPGKGGEEGCSVSQTAPVHAPSKRCLGINVVMA